MADEIRVTDQTAAHPHSAELATGADATVVPARTEPAPATAPVTGEAGDPTVARAQIERTRMRMSETIDEIEDVLIRKKEQIQDRLDVMAPVRERPMVALGVVLGAGVLFGMLTGGDDRDDDRDAWARANGLGRHDELEERAETWEQRARRLLRIAREQEDELEALRGSERLSAAWRPDAERARDADADDPSGLERLADQVSERVTDFVTQAVRGMFRTG